MTASTITFAVQIGSGGFDIARMVAEKLKYRYYDWEVTSQAAAQAGVSPETVVKAEHAQSLLDRIVENLLVTGAYEDDEPVSRLSSTTMASAIHSLTSRDYRQLIEQVVKGLAEGGEGVIVGHAGQMVLREKPDVLKVLIKGSPERRAQRLAADEDAMYVKALVMVRDSDKDRLSFFKQAYGVDLLSASLYDLVLDTDRLPLSLAADIVSTAATNLPGLIPEAAMTGEEELRSKSASPYSA